MTQETQSTRRSGLSIWLGIVIVIAGMFMTNGTLGPIVGILVALVGIAVLTVGLLRR